MEIAKGQAHPSLEAKNNLIFVGQQDDNNHFINFRGDEWKETKAAIVIARGI